MVLALLAALWVVQTWQTLEQSRQQPVPDYRLLLAERIGLAGRYAESLPGPLRSLFLDIAVRLEGGRLEKAILQGQAVPESEAARLSPGYRLAAAGPGLSSQARFELLAHVYFGLQRLGLCLLFSGGPLLLLLMLAWNEQDEQQERSLAQFSLGLHKPMLIFLVWSLGNGLVLATLARHWSATLGSWPTFWLNQLLSYLVPVLLMLLLADRSWRPWGSISWRWSARGYLLCLIGIPLSNAAVRTLTGVDPFLSNPTLGLVAAASTAMLLPIGFLAVFVGPLFEEFLFRGWLLGGLRERFGDRWAVLGSSLLFALAHGSLWNAPALLVSGLVLGWLALRSGGVGSCVVVHGLWNLTWLCQAKAYLP